MRPYLRHIYYLGLKEIKSVFNDPVIVIILLYFFTLDVMTAAHGVNLDVHNASMAVVDFDHSAISQQIRQAFHQPYFHPANNIPYSKMKSDLDKGLYTFVLVIPNKFMSDLYGNRQPAIQLNIDATAVTQAYLGSGYIQVILQQVVNRYMQRQDISPPSTVNASVRVLYNQGLEGTWFLGQSELVMVMAILSLILPGTALLREKEHGTVEHLLVMPLYPLEIMLAKIWSNLLIILVGFILFMLVIVHGVLHIPMNGSWLLLIIGTIIFQFVATSMGMALATFARNIPQHAILSILILFPMVLLSGAWTPQQSMSPFIQFLMLFSPLKYYFDFVMALVFRGAGIAALWRDLLVMLAMGAIFFSFCAFRFRLHFGNQ